MRLLRLRKCAMNAQACDAAEIQISEVIMNSTVTDLQSISAYGPARSSVSGSPLRARRAAADAAPIGTRHCILSAGMIYLRDNPLLREPLKPEHIKNRLLGHWGSDPGRASSGSTSTG